MSGRAAILGLGQRGVQWAETCLAAGWEVAGFDPDARAGGDLSGGPAWRRESTISGAVASADWVICCLPERIELMRSVVQRAQASASDAAVIALVTEDFDVEAVQGCAMRPGRVFRLSEGEDGEIRLDFSPRNDTPVRDAATEALALLNAARMTMPTSPEADDFAEANAG